MFWDTVRRNVVYALRSLRRNAGFATAAVLILGVGIGASTATFSALDGIALRPLPYDDPASLVSVEVRMASLEDPSPSSIPDFVDWRERLTSLESMAAVQPTSIIASSDEGAERVASARVSPDFFRVLGVSLAVGRSFSEAEHRPGAHPAVVISHDSWVRRFGAETRLDRISLETADGPEGQPRVRTVVGVMPRGFFWPEVLGEEPEFWVPLSLDDDVSSARRGARTAHVIGRLASGRTLEIAREEAASVAAELATTFPDTWTDQGIGHGIAVVPLHQRVVDGATTKLFIFWGASGLLLLIGVVNVANLLHARASTRRSEIAVRTALGASRSQLIALLTSETLTISVVGGLLGTAVAHLAIDGLQAFGPQILPRLHDVSVDGRALTFALSLSVTVGVLLGVGPALFSARLGPGAVLRSRGRSSVDRITGRSRDVLVSIEAALAMMLLSASGLLVYTYANLHDQELGFEPEGLATARVSLNTTYSGGTSRIHFFEELQRRVGALAGVQAVGMIQDPPVSFYGWWLPEVFADVESGLQPLRVLAHTITTGYFEAAGIGVLRGRAISAADADGPLVTVLSESAARSLWPGEDALGKQLRLGPESDPMEVVGIVGDVRQAELDSEMRGSMYVPYSRAPLWGSMVLMVRMEAGIPVPVSAMRAGLAEMDASIPLARVELMTDTVADALVPARFNASILVAFAGVALLLAVVGIYGVLHFLVGERQHELGVRLALGARRAEIVLDVWRRGMLPVASGIAVGVVGSAWLSRLMVSLLYGVPDFDLLTHALAAAGLGVAATMACLGPANRASKVDPVTTLGAN